MQEDLMYCVSRDYIESDRDLNANYRKSLKQLTIAEQGKLRLEQRNWLKVKDKKCNQLYLNMKDGREAPIDFLSCHAEENSKRAKILAVR